MQPSTSAAPALRALRAALGTSHPSHHGPYFDYADVVVEPHTLRRDTPIWVGGRTARSLRRAVSLATGWAPFGLGTSAIAAMLAEHDRPAGFDVVLQPNRALDPLGASDTAAEILGEMRDAGATHVTLRFAHHSAAHYVEQLEAAMDLTI